MKFTVQEEGTLLELLCRKLHPASRTTVRKLIQRGAVTLDGETVTRGDVSVLPEQTVEIQKQQGARTSGSTFPILYEDDHVIAVNKPAGLLSIATDKERTKTLYKGLNQYVQLRSKGRERIFIVHRLDREASGIMLFAKSLEAQERLQRGWPGTEKLYCALVEGRPPQAEGTIRNWLRENRAHKVYSCPEGPEAKLAVTHYRRIKVLPKHTLLEIRLETGRKHQIRVHLAEMGYPIVGDRRYGANQSPIRRLGLCAYSLAFDHPFSGRRVKLVIPISKAMRDFRGKR
ncbi:MAG: RluA family pseudouridine synthase [Candidatus Eisenbacteria bacterium]|uniref:Pseudouridine synthase n=1 Tax=Eiseniibacteriota bacterium TaxID=2212470 RepID=A0A948RW96_UNCEI|nr:RluA family pseudouridine synthase [Candidatus Eisenbacteria bacterium]MBU1948050.1 RluA family pseudouridine synthase [Candidatus Eisenbacteria bacterium]MBU2690824.1 RluA family pseudouridine synthase [Candidatus Eisenbacteria bacterium]